MIVLPRRLCSKVSLNVVGIPMLPESKRLTLFGPKNDSPHSDKVIDKVHAHLKEHDLWGRKVSESTFPSEFPMPPLLGSNIVKHFDVLGKQITEPYSNLLEILANMASPNCPKEWLLKPGWIRYVEGKEPQSVPEPLENAVVFDVETMSNFPVMACVFSEKAVYFWCSNWLVSSLEDKPGTLPSPEELITFGNIHSPTVIVGHNVSYDRYDFNSYHFPFNKIL